MQARLGAFPLGALLALAACGAEPQEAGENAPGAVAEENGPAVENCALTGQPEPIGECDLLGEQYAGLDAGVDAFLPNETMREYERTTIRYAITRLPEEVQGGDGELAEAIDQPPELEAPGPVFIEDDGIGAEPEEPAVAPSEPEPESEPSPEPQPTPAPTGPTQAEIDAAIAEAEADVTSAVTARREAGEVETRVIKMARRMRACLDADESFEIEGEACRTIDTFERSVATWRWSVTPTQPGDHTLLVQSSVVLLASDGSVRLVPQEGQDAEITVEVTAYGRWRRFLDEAEAWIRSPLGVLAALAALVGAIGLLIGAVRRARRGEGPPPG